MVLADVLVPQNATNTSGMTFTDRRLFAQAISIADAVVTTIKLANLAVTKAKVAAAAIDSSKIDYSVTGKVWWEELGRTKLASAGSVISVTSLAAKRYLRILSTGISNGGTLQVGVRFNNDSSAIYNFGYITQSAATGAVGTQGQVALSGVVVSGGNWNLDAQITNTPTLNKQLDADVAFDITNIGNGYAPGWQKTFAKWVNTTDPITRVDLVLYGGTGNFGVGSELIVLGHD